jgi:hypothetical protein
VSPTFKVQSALSLFSEIAAFSEKIIFFPASSTLITFTLNSFPISHCKCSKIFAGSAHSTLG